MVIGVIVEYPALFIIQLMHRRESSTNTEPSCSAESLESAPPGRALASTLLPRFFHSRSGC